MNITGLILNRLKAKGEIRASDIVKATGFSRAYVNRFFLELRNEGKIVLLGKANRARYVLANTKDIKKAKLGILEVNKILENKNLEEDRVLEDIKKRTGIFIDLPENVSSILDYAFSEMLNNAIEHSSSDKIRVFMARKENNIRFDVIDSGVGIFNNIMKKRNLNNEMEAIQDILKGKQSTAPETHSGEGIFFTSKLADTLILQGSDKKVIFNNQIDDIFIDDSKTMVGTKVIFNIGLDSKKYLERIFGKYTDDSYTFNKTKVAVKLYMMDAGHISRSQARRILSGLEKFSEVSLDFKNVSTVGQGFADEAFRVWAKQHPDIKIIPQNINENVKFMIDRALGSH